jgi:hypothetical protein
MPRDPRGFVGLAFAVHVPDLKERVVAAAGVILEFFVETTAILDRHISYLQLSGGGFPASLYGAAQSQTTGYKPPHDRQKDETIPGRRPDVMSDDREVLLY